MPRPPDLSKLDLVIHSPARLAIMAMLAGEDEVEFTCLRDRLELSDGNLGAHLRRLEDAGYVKCSKAFLARKPRTTYRISPRGRSAFERHLSELEEIIRGNRRNK